MAFSLKHRHGVQEDVVAALALTGQTLMGQAVMVKSSEVCPCILCPVLTPLAVLSVCCLTGGPRRLIEAAQSSGIWLVLVLVSWLR